MYPFIYYTGPRAFRQFADSKKGKSEAKEKFMAKCKIGKMRFVTSKRAENILKDTCGNHEITDEYTFVTYRYKKSQV